MEGIRGGGSLRAAMVARLVAEGAIRTEPVRAAFETVARERFVPEIAARQGLEAIYRTDEALVTATDDRGVPISSSSAPAIMAPMLEELQLGPGLRVLEVGAGTGYNAAVLKRLVGDTGTVTSMDVDARFACQARRALAQGGHSCRVVVGDGHQGWPSGAPFDRIIATASCDHVPRAWRDQVVDGGLVELPLRLTETLTPQLVTCFRRVGDQLRSTAIIGGAFMGLRQPGNGPAPVVSAPRVSASGGGKPPRFIRSLEGEGVAALSSSAARRALASLLGRGRRLHTISRSGTDALNLYLTLSRSPRVLSCTIDARVGVAVVAPGGSSIVTVTRASGQPGQVEAWGDDHAEPLFGGHLQRWEQAGRPTLGDLEVIVSYTGGEAAQHWQTFRRHDSTIALDWAEPPRTELGAGRR